MPSINQILARPLNASDNGLICFSHVTHEVTEDFSPWDPRTVAAKQDGGGCTSVTPALPLPELEKEEEKEDTSEPLDMNPCSATYSNLGKCKCHISNNI